MKKEFEEPSVLVMPMLSTTQIKESAGGDDNLGDVELPWVPVG